MTIDFFKENYPTLYKGNEYYFEHNQTAIEYVVRAYTEGYDSGKMSAEDEFKDKIEKLETEIQILKVECESYESQVTYFEKKSNKLENENETLNAYAKKLTETKIDETMQNRIKYLEEENQKLKADNERLSDNLINVTKDDDDFNLISNNNKALLRKYNEMKKEVKALREANTSINSSSESSNNLLNKFSDTQLTSILGERGYKGELSKSERLYSTNMQSSVGENIKTIKLG